MHFGHDHDHHHGHHGGGHLGHNREAPRRAAQWQTPHRPDEPHHDHGRAPEPDLDLVETAFAEGFATATDPTSFLRLAQVPFTATAPDGTALSLLRVEIEAATDVG